MDVLYVIRHREAGAIGAYLTPYDAGRALALMLLDDPERLDDVWLEPFELVVAEPVRR
jgi:hypothetical protein